MLRIGIRFCGQGKVHETEIEFSCGLLPDTLGLVGPRCEKNRLLLGKVEKSFVASQPGPASWKLFGDLLNHLETRFIRRMGKADLAAREAQEHFLFAEASIAVEIDLARSQVC